MNETEQRKVSFLSRFYMVFTLSLFAFALAGYLSGDDGAAITNLYSLGKKGLTYSAIAQLVFTSLGITTIVHFFFSERLFPKMMIMTRIVCGLICIVILLVFCILVFNWFSSDYVIGWVGFFTSFGICFTVSTIGTLWKTRADERKYKELLEHYKNMSQQEEAHETTLDE